MDLRVRFAALPFPATHTQAVVWYFDIDEDHSAWTELGPPGTDLFLAINGLTGGALGATGAFGIPGVGLCEHGSVDPGTNTFRVLFPSTLFPSQAAFNYVVASTFGGSFGANEVAPDLPSFSSAAGFFTSDADEPPPFNGLPICTTVDIDVRLGTDNNTIRVNTPSPIKVAILSHDGFLAASDVIHSTLVFGHSPGGGAGSLLTCSAPRDVNRDGLEDLVCTFDQSMTNLGLGDNIAYLQGSTVYGTFIMGAAFVTVVATGQ